MDKTRCIDCRRCEQACDMGIPVWEQGKATAAITGLEDCMGCARCVVSCPTDALDIRDVRNLLRPGVRRDASRLLGRPPGRRRRGAAPGPPRRAHRRLGRDACRWTETLAPRPRAASTAAYPTCRKACPLRQPHPGLAGAAAAGRWTEAAEILAQATSPLPEVCGPLCPQHRLCEGACARGRQGEGP